MPHTSAVPLPEPAGGAANIISRREVEPLLLRASGILKSYERATGVVVSVLDQNGRFIETPHHQTITRFCSVCKKHCPHLSLAENTYPCTAMHRSGVKEARKAGGIYIYMCELGFMFWTSPLVSNGRESGALAAGGVIGIRREEVIRRFCAKSHGEIGPDQAEEYLQGIPERSREAIEALAKIMLICAEQTARENEDYPETVRRIAEQKSYRSNQLRLISGKYAPNEVPGYPLDKERMLLAALRRGDNETGQKILNELLGILLITNPNNFKYMQMRAIELVVLLSRAAKKVEPSSPANTGDNTILETNNRYFKRIQDARNQEELTDILHLVVDRMAGQIFSFQGIRHASALRRAERYIWENYTRKLSLREIAAASGLSAPYFSSIFKEEMGENLSNYLNRLRVERAAAMLTESDLSLNSIAASCGFEDQSWFSKIFKSYTGISPGKYRERGAGTLSPAKSISSAADSEKNIETG